MLGQTFPQSPQWSLGKQANVTSIITPPGGVAFLERMTHLWYLVKGNQNDKRIKITATPPGFEPEIPWFVVRCLICWATGPFYQIFSRFFAQGWNNIIRMKIGRLKINGTVLPHVAIKWHLNSLNASATTTSRNFTPATRGCEIVCKRGPFFYHG